MGSIEDEPVTALRSYKNLTVVGLGYLFLFSAFASLQNLTTSLHDPRLGFASLCTIYVFFLSSCLVIPNILIKKIGAKYTLAVSMVGFVLFTLANYYPTWATLLIASGILGLCAAPLWTAQASYTTTLAINYAESAKLEKDAVISKFFCIFYLLFQCGQVIGNVISSLVLKPNVVETNGTDIIRTDCGASYCPLTNTSSKSDTVEKSTVITLLSIYIAFGALAIACIVFLLDKIKPKKSESGVEPSTLESILATVKLMKDYRIWLLVPLTMFTGLEQAFAFGDLTNAFVSCHMGIEKVGFIMICFGAVGGMASLAIGLLVKYTGTFALMMFGTVLHLCVFVWCLLWKTHVHPEIMFFVTAGIWGLLDSIWATQVNALYGIIFSENKDPAFAHFKLWQSLGFVISFAYGTHLCTSIKIYVLIVVLIVGILGYCIVEYKHRQGKRTLQVITNDEELKRI